MKPVSEWSGWNLYASDCPEALVNQQIVEHYLEIDDTGRMVNPPKTDDELEEFVELFYGVRFPKKVMTPGHKSPWQFMCDLFFERVKAALGFANRTGGKTYLIAVLNHLDMLFKWKCDVTSAGAVKDQAQRCYGYYTELNELPGFQEFAKRFARVTGRRFVENSTQQRTELGNGAKLETITGSEKGFRGPHPNKNRIDEIDELEWDVLQTGLSMSQTTNGIRGQDVFTSTRQREHGSMDRMIEEADKRNVKVYEWNIWDTLERCDRRCIDDPVHGTCPVISKCNGKAHGCDGYYKIDDFVGKVAIMDDDKFAREWENKGAAGELLVYSGFSRARHVMTPERLKLMTGMSEKSRNWPVVCGLDFGASPGNPFCYIKLCQLPNHAWMVYWEYVAELKLLRDHAACIKSAPDYVRGEQAYCDWDNQDRMELISHGLRLQPAVKGPDTVSVGINLIKEYLEGYPSPRVPGQKDPFLYVWHDCIHTLKEFGRYKWPKRPDGKPDKSGRPQDGNDHCLDAMRYGLFSKYRLGQQRYFARSTSKV